jgi:hypothetical protein
MRKSLVLIAALALNATPALADPACTAQTTRGFWGWTCDGYLAPAPGAPLVPTRIMGTCNASRTAYWDCEGSVNLGGQVLPQTLKGQAVVNGDCTGTITYAQTIFGQPVPDLHIRYYITDQGDGIKGLPTDPNQVLSCVLNRLDKNAND